MTGRKVAVVGGGPGGLFLARLLKLADRAWDVTVYERNAPDATFGFGVVFSARTLNSLRAADIATHDRIVAVSEQWTDMELRSCGQRQRVRGFGFTAIARATLLSILQEQAAEVGVEILFETEADLGVRDSAEIVVAADGVNSGIRTALARQLGSREETGRAKYAWFGTRARFDAVTFPFVATEHGAFGAHAYPFDPATSTFIVETDENTWRAAGMEASTAAAEAPGASDEFTRRYLERVFAEHLDGHGLLTNNSKWSSFRVVHNERWHHDGVVLVGDAAHTAHFSVGSGTKLAMEDAVALSRALLQCRERDEALVAYEELRRPDVARTQDWALPSQHWWESFGRRAPTPQARLALHFLTRTSAMTYEGLRRRDPAIVDAAERSYGADAGAHAIAEPFAIAGIELARNRLAVALPAELTMLADAYASAGAGVVILAHDASEPTLELARASGAAAALQLPLADVARGPACGADMVELVASIDDPRLAGSISRLADGGMPTFLLVPFGDDDPWSRRAERRLARLAELAGAGLSGVRLAPAGETVSRPLRGAPLPALPGIGLADRVRTELELAVALTSASGWLSAAVDGAPGEPWSDQAHVALVSGRVDLLVSVPVVRRSRERCRRLALSTATGGSGS